jgi:hypothetical protein
LNLIYKALIDAVGLPNQLPPDQARPGAYLNLRNDLNYIYKAILANIAKFPIATSDGQIIYWDNSTSTWVVTNAPADGQYPVWNASTGQLEFESASYASPQDVSDATSTNEIVTPAAMLQNTNLVKQSLYTLYVR